jgi:hypothetical protein
MRHLVVVLLLIIFLQLLEYPIQWMDNNRLNQRHNQQQSCRIYD